MGGQAAGNRRQATGDGQRGLRGPGDAGWRLVGEDGTAGARGEGGRYEEVENQVAGEGAQHRVRVAAEVNRGSQHGVESTQAVGNDFAGAFVGRSELGGAGFFEVVEEGELAEGLGFDGLGFVRGVENEFKGLLFFAEEIDYSEVLMTAREQRQGEGEIGMAAERFEDFVGECVGWKREGGRVGQEPGDIEEGRVLGNDNRRSTENELPEAVAVVEGGGRGAEAGEVRVEGRGSRQAWRGNR